MAGFGLPRKVRPGPVSDTAAGSLFGNFGLRGKGVR